MSGSEVLYGQAIPEHIPQEPIPVLRVFPIAPRPLAEILEEIKSKPVSDVNFVECLMLKTNDTLSRDLLSVPGGEYHPDRPFAEESMRMISDRLTALADSPNAQKKRISEVFESVPGYTYDIGDSYPLRTARVTTLFVRSEDISTVAAREGNNGPQDRIKAVVPVTLANLESLVENGLYENSSGRIVRVVGSLTSLPSPDTHFSADPGEIAKKNKALNTVIVDAKRRDVELKGETLRAINKIRIWSGQQKAESLDVCTPNEISFGFIAAQEAINLMDERMDREMGGAKKGVSPRARDLLRAAAYGTAVPTEYATELLFASRTREIIHAVRNVRNGMWPAVDALYAKLGKKEVPKNIIHALEKVWPELTARGDRFAIIRELDAIAVTSFAKELQVSEETIHEALKIAQKFHVPLTENIKLNKDLPDYFQEHEPLNEVRGARLFTLMAMSIGLHPNREMDPNGLPGMILEFESQRSLATMLVAVEAIQEIERLDDVIDEIQGAVDRFFPGEPKGVWLELSDGREHNMSSFTVDLDGSPVAVYLDERGKKEPESLARKLLQEPGDIHDIYTVNFALAADQEFPMNDVETCLSVGEKLHTQLVAHISASLGHNGWKVREQASNSKKETLRQKVEKLAAMTPKERKENLENAGGKRAGSSGNLILRDKFIMEIEKEGQTYPFEVNIYPFESTAQGSLSDVLKGNWGFVEKLDDNAKRAYDAKRVFARDTKAPAGASLYDDYFSTFLYDRLMSRLAEHVVERETPDIEGDENSFE